MAERTINVKMAKASQEDIAAVIAFFQMIEEIEEYGTYTPTDDSQTIEIEDDSQYLTLISEAWQLVGPAWSRVVFGYTTLVKNCCDPDADTLEWRPDIQRLLEQQTSQED